MPDWHQLVRRSMRPLGLAPAREEEICSELADHLEDSCEALQIRGLASEQATLRTLTLAEDWDRLARELRSAEEGNMNDRTRTFWIPGMVTLFLSAFVLRLVIWTGWQPSVVWLEPHWRMLGRARFEFVFYFPWLALLPVIGALGAWWAKRVGGIVSTRLLIGLFPVLSFGALLVTTFVLLVPIADPHVPMAVKAVGLATYLVGWVLIPGAALLLGTLPFLRNHSPART